MEETRNSPYGEDRISRLPDSLIHQILSFIDTKYAVQTSVLSKRWIDIWKSLPFLYFNRNSFSHEKAEKFIDFVYMVFLYRDDTNIQKFSVDVGWEDSAFDNTMIMNVNRWSLNAVKHNVQEINIVIDELLYSPYEIPRRLLSCKSLRKLVMKVSSDAFADVILPRSMNLPQLKVLILYGLSVSKEELFDGLLSSCPVLETLEIVDCVMQINDRRNSIIDSVSLKKFTYSCWLIDKMDHSIKLCAPNLKIFNWTSFLIQDFSLENCSSLSELVLRWKPEEDGDTEAYSSLTSEKKEVYAKRMMQFLGAVNMVKAMKLSSVLLEVLSRVPDLSDCQPPRLRNLQYLTLEMWPARGCLRSIAFLLSISPNVVEI
ncbi:FBD-associated F-box protein At4g13985-like [Papaver somniferum]|uniref:FBD-associated F-box protein At4g13985-like n=1 Tax=Papaver somniferum TaxID=3469 RepID=UPI000E6FC60C|nr:FBD-associated F-box protein At4g13985-like [Papaver somniferum]